MLNVTDISKRIENPNLVVPEDLKELQDLTNKYPYTQLFSILYLKALSKAGDVRFDDELKRHSFRISDRVQLYYLIQDHESKNDIESAKIISEPQAAVETKTAVEIESLPEVNKASVEVILEEEKNEVESTPTPPSETELISEQVVSKEPLLEINLDIESEEVSSTYLSEEIVLETKVKSEQEELEVNCEKVEPVVIETEEEIISFEDKKEESIEIVIPSDNLEESILHNIYAANYRLEELTEDESSRLEAQKTPEIEKNTASEEVINENNTELEPQSFTNWLHSDNNYSESDKSDKEAINAVVESFSEFDPSSELFGEVDKPRAEFFSPAKKAKKSLEENELPVSETLAKIYIMQGNYPQAISAYKQLSLAFPEKKIFFANLIEDLEKKINT